MFLVSNKQSNSPYNPELNRIMKISEIEIGGYFTMKNVQLPSTVINSQTSEYNRLENKRKRNYLNLFVRKFQIN